MAIAYVANIANDRPGGGNAADERGWFGRYLSALGNVRDPLLLGVAYYLGALTAFGIGTLSDSIFAPFWPPNVILFVALVRTSPERWPWFILAALPAHAA